MRIAELYKSVQGEGLLTGVESVFVRASGCNLRCWYCDTPYASWKPEGEDVSVEDIVSQVAELDCGHVVITGGEPMLFAELIPLTKRLAALGLHITIETAGTLYLPVDCQLMSISPKLAGSAPVGTSAYELKWKDRHELTRHAPEVIRQLISSYDYQIKFVVDSVKDCEEVERYLSEIPEIGRDRVMLMPQGTDLSTLQFKEPWLRQYCDQHALRYCPRKQIEWFGWARGT